MSLENELNEEFWLRDELTVVGDDNGGCCRTGRERAADFSLLHSGVLEGFGLTINVLVELKKKICSTILARNFI